MNKKHVASALLVGIAGVLLYFVAYACSSPPGPSPQPAPTPAPAPAPTPTPTPVPLGVPHCADGSVIGKVRTEACPSGQTGTVTQVCAPSAPGADPTWIDTSKTCVASTTPACSLTTFADVQPILTQNCAGCHASITDYTTAVSWASEIVRRVQLPPGNNDHMPQANGSDPVKSLDGSDVQKLSKWQQDGTPRDCTSAQAKPNAFIDLDYQDSVALADATAQLEGDRANILYVYAGHAINDGQNVDVWGQALSKALNSVNPSLQTVVKPQQVDGRGAVWRVDLRNYDIDATKLQAILAADVNIHFQDQTSKGLTLTALLGHTPWLHLDNFIDIMFRNSAVYNKLLNQGTTIQQLEQQIGVNEGQQLADSSAQFIGSNQSPIAEQKNRLIVRFTEARGSTFYAWRTFDVNATPHDVVVNVNGQDVLEDTKSLQNFPCLNGTGCNAIYTQDASELIYTLPNGGQAYLLADANGNVLNFADPNVVIDTQTPLGNRVINNANSCLRCHNDGLIPMTDEILQHVKTNSAQFNQTDAQIIVGQNGHPGLYRDAGVNTATFKRDNTLYRTFLTQAGVKPGPDPQNVVTDYQLLNWNLAHLGDELFLTQDQITACLNSSAVGKAQIGALLDGHSVVTFQQISAVLPQLQVDCNVGRDPRT